MTQYINVTFNKRKIFEPGAWWLLIAKEECIEQQQKKTNLITACNHEDMRLKYFNVCSIVFCTGRVKQMYMYRSPQSHNLSNYILYNSAKNMRPAQSEKHKIELVWPYSAESSYTCTLAAGINVKRIPRAREEFGTSYCWFHFRGLVQSPYGKINVIMTLGGRGS